MGARNYGVKIQGDETKEPKNLGDKIGRKALEIEIWDRKCRNEFTGGKLRE